MRFRVLGPYRLARDGALVSRSAEDRRALWHLMEADAPGLVDACGCYVLSIRRRAWYVGMAARQSFSQECFALHKINVYNYALQKVRGEPLLHLIAKLTPTGRFASPAVNGHPDIEFLETMLIGMALRQNENLQNIRGTRFLREMRVPGILRTGKGEGNLGSVKALRDVLGIASSKGAARDGGDSPGIGRQAAAIKVSATGSAAEIPSPPNKRMQPARTGMARG